jgi:hypothetical protein
MTAPFTVPVPAADAADASRLLQDIQIVACHISTVGELLIFNPDTSCLGDLINDLGLRLLRDLDSYSSFLSQSSN